MDMTEQGRWKINIGTWIIAALMLVMAILTGFYASVSFYGDIRDSSSKKINIEYFKDTWNDHVMLKGRLGSADSLLSFLLLKDLDSRRVILGEDRWLFYRSSDDNTKGTMGDYTGQSLPDEATLETTSEHLLDIQENLKSREIGFVVLVGPNKSSVYYEHMPKEYKRAEMNRSDIMCEYLHEQDINIVNPKALLIEAKSKYPLYYKYDTHWNQLGAYIACREALKPLGILIPEIESYDIATTPLQYHYCAYDDLADMVGLKSIIFNDEVEQTITELGTIDWERIEAEQRYGNPTSLSYYLNPDAEYDSTILLIGDSFRTAMISTMTHYVSDLYVISHEAYQSDIIEKIHPDHIIFECVERDSAELGTFELLD